MLTRRKKHQKRWTIIDYALAEAVHMLDAEKCGKCGTPAWHAFSENPYILFEVDEIKCEACATLDEHQEKHKDSKKTPGVTEVVNVVHADWALGDKDAVLPGRKDWLVEMQKKAEREAAK